MPEALEARQEVVIDLEIAAGPDLEDEDFDLVLSDAVDYPVVADPELPQPGVLAPQRSAVGLGVRRQAGADRAQEAALNGWVEPGKILFENEWVNVNDPHGDQCRFTRRSASSSER